MVRYYNESSDNHKFKISGTVDDWRERVGSRVIGNSRLVFAIACGLASALLKPLGESGGGFHLFDTTTKGKTTTLIVAGSVCGGGDPPWGFVRSWNTTANGAEAIAPLHNDSLLCLDELNMAARPEDVAKLAYVLSNGQTTQRANRTGGARKTEHFLLLFISTGEQSFRRYLEDKQVHFHGWPRNSGCATSPATPERGLVYTIS